MVPRRAKASRNQTRLGGELSGLVTRRALRRESYRRLGGLTAVSGARVNWLPVNPVSRMADHHSYVEVVCPSCSKVRTTRKDLLAKAAKEGKSLMCKSCAMKARPVTWKKNPEDIRREQGAYKSYSRAKRRVAVNHNGAYGHVEFRFESYEQFLAELGPRPEGMTLDRIDPNGHYEPGNVRWATMKEQSQNRRSNVYVNFNGQKMCIHDAAKAAGIDVNTIKRRIAKGYPEVMWFMKGRIDYEVPQAQSS